MQIANMDAELDFVTESILDHDRMQEMDYYEEEVIIRKKGFENEVSQETV